MTDIYLFKSGDGYNVMAYGPDPSLNYYDDLSGALAAVGELAGRLHNQFKRAGVRIDPEVATDIIQDRGREGLDHWLQSVGFKGGVPQY